MARPAGRFRDVLDTAMGDGAAQKRDLAQTEPFDVGDELALPPQEPVIFLAPDRLADTA